MPPFKFATMVLAKSSQHFNHPQDRLLKPKLKAPQSFKTSTTTETSCFSQSLTDRQDGNYNLCSSETSWAKHCCFVNIKNCGSAKTNLKFRLPSNEA